MTHEQNDPLPASIARSALIAGFVSVILLALYLFTPWGPAILFGGMLVGLAGIVLGAVALKRGQPRGVATVGVILGAAGLIVGAAILLFALMFVGALG